MNSPSYDFSDMSMTVLVISLHSGQWWNLYLNVGADILKHLCGSIQPNQLFGLEVAVDGNRSPTQKSVMKCKPFPTLLIFTNFSLPSIDIGWNNVTCAISCNLSTNECLKVLKMSTFSGILSGRASGWHHSQLWHTYPPFTTVFTGIYLQSFCSPPKLCWLWTHCQQLWDHTYQAPQ